MFAPEILYRIKIYLESQNHIFFYMNFRAKNQYCNLRENSNICRICKIIFGGKIQIFSKNHRYKKMARKLKNSNPDQFNIKINYEHVKLDIYFALNFAVQSDFKLKFRK